MGVKSRPDGRGSGFGKAQYRPCCVSLRFVAPIICWNRAPTMLARPPQLRPYGRRAHNPRCRFNHFSTAHFWEFSIFPRRLEPLRRQLSVADRVLNIFMSKVVLQPPAYLDHHSRACPRTHAAACAGAPENGNLLPSPVRENILRKPAGDIGDRRSVRKTCRDSGCSRSKRRRERSSVPPSGCTLGVPLLTRRA
jgi:hypothetical protein